MTYSILSKEIKQQLEQERSRLVNDREAIVASVTAEVDRLIQHLDVLLGSADATTSTPTNSKKTTSKAASKAPSEVVSEAPKQKTERAKPKAKRSKTTKAFDAKKLKSTFKKMSPSDAVAQILSQSPDQSFETDQLIASLYEPFDEAEMGRARKSVSAVLLHGLRAGKFEKVQENPAQYKFKASSGVAA